MFLSDPMLIVVLAGLFAAYAASVAGLMIVGHAIELKENEVARCSSPTRY